MRIEILVVLVGYPCDNACCRGVAETFGEGMSLAGSVDSGFGNVCFRRGCHVSLQACYCRADE